MKRRSRAGYRYRFVPGWMGLSVLAMFMTLVALAGCSNKIGWRGGDFSQAAAVPAIGEAVQEAAVVGAYGPDAEQMPAVHADLPSHASEPSLQAQSARSPVPGQFQPPSAARSEDAEGSSAAEAAGEEAAGEKAAAGAGEASANEASVSGVSAGEASAEGADAGEAADWIALTFDDGPDAKYTPQVLDILKEYGVKATFFLVGTQVEKYPDIAKRIVEEGHTVGNHSWSHQDLTKLSGKALDSQIKRTQEVIAEATGVEPVLVRAPYGALSDDLIQYFHELKLLHVYWTIDPRDWAGTPVADMRRNIAEHAKPGGIILLHSFGGRKNALDHTLELLPLVIEDLQQAGYAFATVEELIETKAVAASAIK